MFCPRCGQRAAEEVRFCSRCGLPLDAAAEVVEAEGRPGWSLAEATESPARLTPRQVGVRKGLLWSAGGAVSFGIAILLTAFKEDLFVLLLPAGVLLVIGVMRVLYGLLLEGHAPGGGEGSPQPELERGAPRAKELPHARTVPASFYDRPSVTESTTKLLDEQRRER